ncbi:MAG: serine--tRNA ligase, partial [Candidatus Altiarchaeota archaeon]|nr:serine--tRNA ligase [Candidatus Altiarchaeota archaeon]
MIDIKLIRETPQVVKESLSRRDMDTSVVDQIRKLDEDWRLDLKKVEDLKHERNVINQEIAAAKKGGKDIESGIGRVKKISQSISKTEEEVEKIREKINTMMLEMPNILHESVPAGAGEDDNETIKTWGKPPEFSFKPKNHIELGEDLDLIDIERAAKVSGARFYYLKNEAVTLEFALVSFVLDYLKKQG